MNPQYQRGYEILNNPTALWQYRNASQAYDNEFASYMNSSARRYQDDAEYRENLDK
jgi:hypothetical protein